MNAAAQPRVWMRAVMVLVMATLLAPAGLRAAPAAFDQAPAGAHMILVIPSMKGLSDKLAKLQADLGIPAPEMADLLGTIKAEGGITAGLKDDGAAMLVITDLGAMINGDAVEPPMAIAVEVTDYAAFVGNFQGNAADAVTKLTMPNGGEDGYAKKVGDFAVFGPKEADIVAYQPGNAGSAIAKAAGTLGEGYLSTGDVAMYLDLKALGPILKPKVAEGFDQMMAELEANMPADQLAMMKGVFGMYRQAIDAVLTDGQALVQTVDFSDEGVGINYILQATPGSGMTKFFPGGTSGGAALLASLPKQPYLIASAFDTKAIDLATLLDKALAAMPEDGGWITKLYKDALPMARMTKANAWAWYAPPAGQMMMGPGLMNVVSVYDTTDGPGYLAAAKTYFVGINNTKLPGMPGAEPAMITSGYTPNASQIEGVNVDQYGMSVQLPPEMMQQMGPAAGMLMMMGGLNYTGFIAAKGDNVVMSSSLDATMITEAIKAAGTDTGLGSDAALGAARKAALPPSPAIEAHISVEGIMSAVNPMLQMFAGQALPVPQGLAPISMGVGVEDGGVAARLYLPVKTMKGIADTVQAAQAQMGGGMNKGGADDEGAAPPPF